MVQLLLYTRCMLKSIQIEKENAWMTMKSEESTILFSVPEKNKCKNAKRAHKVCRCANKMHPFEYLVACFSWRILLLPLLLLLRLSLFVVLCWVCYNRLFRRSIHSSAEENVWDARIPHRWQSAGNNLSQCRQVCRVLCVCGSVESIRSLFVLFHITGTNSTETFYFANRVASLCNVFC